MSLSLAGREGLPVAPQTSYDLMIDKKLKNLIYCIQRVLCRKKQALVAAVFGSIEGERAGSMLVRKKRWKEDIEDDRQ